MTTLSHDLDLHAEIVRLTKLLTKERARSERLTTDLEITNEHLRRAIDEVDHLMRTVERYRGALLGEPLVETFIPQGWSEGE